LAAEAVGGDELTAASFAALAAELVGALPRPRRTLTAARHGR
jgi:hypothetical protein